MGMDFAALLKYEPISDKTLQLVEQLEVARPVEIRAVGDYWRQSGFFPFSIAHARWVTDFKEYAEVGRPQLPSLTHALQTPEGFFLVFGADAVYIYHPLRWYLFLTDLVWQKYMLDACKAFAKVLHAVDGIVTSDFSPVIGAFMKGMLFDEALHQTKEIEVANVGELYIQLDAEGTWDSRGYWRFLRKNQSDCAS